MDLKDWLEEKVGVRHGPVVGGVDSYDNAILIGLQSKPVYAGTVPFAVKQARRRKNKAARIARRRGRS